MDLLMTCELSVRCVIGWLPGVLDLLPFESRDNKQKRYPFYNCDETTFECQVYMFSSFDVFVLGKCH